MRQLILYTTGLLLLVRAALGLDLTSLAQILSPDSVIDQAGAGAPPQRWSDYEAPSPAAVVHPATESDAQKTLKWAVDRGVPFLVQNGANGWATTFDLDPKESIAIALDLLRRVSFSADGRLATVQGGALTSDVVSAAASAGSLVAAGTCNCVGFLGAALGGGVGWLTGELGLGVDSVVSLNIVRADGASETVAGGGELFWALRGAGPNFAMVTSAVVRAEPVPSPTITAWTGALVFDGASQVDNVLGAIASLDLRAPAALSMTWSGGRIITTVFYRGGGPEAEAEAERVFAPLLALEALSSSVAADVPYSSWNAGADAACAKGGYKPTWGVGLGVFDVGSWRDVYDVWADLRARPGAENSSVLLSYYPMDASRAVPADSASYPFRDEINYFASLTASFTDLAVEDTALEHGRRARELWRKGDGLERPSTYINNAFGDECAETVYGDSLERLQELKGKYDPHGRFNQWFPLEAASKGCQE